MMLPLNITGGYAICYSIYFAQLLVVQSSNSQQLVNAAGKPAAQPGKLLWLHAAGICWLGLVPLALSSPVHDTLTANGSPGFGLMGAFLAALLLAVYLGATDARKFMLAPTLKPAYTTSFYKRYFLLRIPFLICYELFFRGHLLFVNTANIGLAGALLADVLLTVFLHLFSGKKWMLGCIPFSLASCIINVQAHAVWPSILLHLALSLSFEITVLHKFFNSLKSAS